MFYGRLPEMNGFDGCNWHVNTFDKYIRKWNEADFAFKVVFFIIHVILVVFVSLNVVVFANYMYEKTSTLF